MTIYPAENTPIFTPLAQEVGLVCAAVYGVVWRYCQKYDGVCRASLITLGREIKVDRATMMRNIKTLCDSGYLIDQTPGLRNVPHTYVLGKSVAECNSYKEAQANTEEDKSVVIRNSLPPETVAENNKSVAHNNSSIKSVAQNNGKNQTVAESNLKNKESLDSESSNRQSSEISSPNGEGDKSPPPPVEPQIPRVEYTDFQRAFLSRFSAKRFKNTTQHQAVCSLIEQYGESEVSALAEWAAVKGMGLGEAIPAIRSALTNPKRQQQKGQPNNGHYSKPNQTRNTDPDRIPSVDIYALRGKPTG